VTPAQIDGLGANYTTTVTQGADVPQGVPGGLSTGKVLASSPAGHSLGIAQLDARLRLIIPTAVKAGVYHGTLTFQALG
jgi:hypothetical protein